MKPLERIFDRATADPRHIVLAEGHDPRIREAAAEAARRGIARITLLRGPEDDPPEEVGVIDPAHNPAHERLAARFHEKRRHKGVDAGAAARAA